MKVKIDSMLLKNYWCLGFDSGVTRDVPVKKLKKWERIDREFLIMQIEMRKLATKE